MNVFNLLGVVVRLFTETVQLFFLHSFLGLVALCTSPFLHAARLLRRHAHAVPVEPVGAQVTTNVKSGDSESLVLRILHCFPENKMTGCLLCRFFSRNLLWIMDWSDRSVRMIGIYLRSQSAPEKHKKPTNLCVPRTFLRKKVSAMFDNLQPCYFIDEINADHAARTYERFVHSIDLMQIWNFIN